MPQVYNIYTISHKKCRCDHQIYKKKNDFVLWSLSNQILILNYKYVKSYYFVMKCTLINIRKQRTNPVIKNGA